MDLQTKITLNDGNQMPLLGLGCYKSKGDEGARAVITAAETGYRHFDSASYYGNEEEIGRGIRACGVPREELFVVTKLWPSCFSDPREAIEESLKRLDIGYIDCYLLHWPGRDETARHKAWEAVLSYREKGLIRSAGVSNFAVPHLKSLIASCGVVPVVDQVELHPWYQQRELKAYLKQEGIQPVAWGPLFHGHLGEAGGLVPIAENCQKSTAQVVLRWHLQSGHAVIPKSVNPVRIRQNADLFGFALSPEDMERIDGMECGRKFGREPDVE